MLPRLYTTHLHCVRPHTGADFIFLRFVRLIRLQRFLRDNESFSSLQV